MEKNKYYIEDCFCLTLDRVANILRDSSPLDLKQDKKRKDISYGLEKVGEQSFILVDIEGHEQQRVMVHPSRTKAGYQNYVVCGGCQKKQKELYLLPEGGVFLCEGCHEITWRWFKPSSDKENFVRNAERIIHLVELYDSMINRIWNKNIKSERYAEFLAECSRVGYRNIVADIKKIEKSLAYRKPIKVRKSVLPASPAWWKRYF